MPDSEHLTVECLEQGFGLTPVPFEGGSGRNRRRHHRRKVPQDLDSGTVPNSQGLSGGKRKRHGWDDQDVAGGAGQVSGWDKRLVDESALPAWVADLITDIGVSLAPSSLQRKQLETVYHSGPLDGFSNLGQQSMVKLLNFVGNVSNATLHAKLQEGGEVVLEMETVENEVSVVVHRLALEIGRAVVNFGSPAVGGWDLVAQDVFQVPTGYVVVAQVTKVGMITEQVRRGAVRPRDLQGVPNKMVSEQQVAKCLDNVRHCLCLSLVHNGPSILVERNKSRKSMIVVINPGLCLCQLLARVKCLIVMRNFGWSKSPWRLSRQVLTKDMVKCRRRFAFLWLSHVVRMLV